MEKICDKLSKSYGIYCAETIGYFIGYIKQELLDILRDIMGNIFNNWIY